MPWSVRIFTLGRFEVVVDEEADAAAHALTVALHRVRRLLGTKEAFRHEDGKVSLNEHLVWTDVRAFESQLADQPLNGDRAERALGLYRGEFLAEKPDAMWAVSLRERLRGKFVYHVEQAGKVLESANRWHDTIGLYVRGLDADPLSESFYQGLMRCYAALGRRAEALSVYRRMRQQLSVVLGISPSEPSQALARALQRDNPAQVESLKGLPPSEARRPRRSVGHL